jgi:conjugal transfer pilin signal peptidase TrbI
MLDTLHSHLDRRAAVYLWFLVALIAFGRYFTLALNVSDSLPGTVFLVKKGHVAGQGDLVAFRYGGGGPYERGSLFLKRVAGMPDSIVTRRDTGDGDRDYFIDGRYVGRAKPKSRTGVPLDPGPTGVIPQGHYYLASPNPDSLDSRYAWVGWVADAQIVGRAFRVF